MSVEARRKACIDVVTTGLPGMSSPPKLLQALSIPWSSQGTWNDPFGRFYQWDRRGPKVWYCGGLVRTEVDLERFSPDPLKADYKGVEQTVAHAKDEMAVIGAVDGIVELSASSMGLDRFLKALHKEPRFAKRMLEARL